MGKVGMSITFQFRAIDYFPLRNALIKFPQHRKVLLEFDLYMPINGVTTRPVSNTGKFNFFWHFLSKNPTFLLFFYKDMDNLLYFSIKLSTFLRFVYQNVDFLLFLLPSTHIR